MKGFKLCALFTHNYKGGYVKEERTAGEECREHGRNEKWAKNC
jgi:hypothetical protein